MKRLITLNRKKWNFNGSCHTKQEPFYSAPVILSLYLLLWFSIVGGTLWRTKWGINLICNVRHVWHVFPCNSGVILFDFSYVEAEPPYTVYPPIGCRHRYIYSIYVLSSLISLILSRHLVPFSTWQNHNRNRFSATYFEICVIS